ncbi:MAG TPA: alginate lyase family protein [Allosphingosinicella sp.]|jgi:hypothetical protein|nr:alginate lyase family protein [Allosphingosinicella sp.]
MRLFFLLAGMAIAAAPSAAAAALSWCPLPARGAAAERARLVHSLGSDAQAKPHPLPHVHTEGTLPNDPQREASLVAERDWPIMLDNALAWRAGAGDNYLKAAQLYLGAWAQTYQPDFNPIDETNLDALIETWAITRDRLDPEVRTAAARLIRALGEGYLDRMEAAVRTPDPRQPWKNNWQSHRIKIATLAAVALGDRALFDRARAAFDRHRDANIHPDGEVRDFEQRDAIHYVVYDLEPLLRAAIAARRMGEDWYGRNVGGPPVAAALRWLEPYADGTKTHVEFVHSVVAFDAARAKAGVKGFNGPFDPARATELIWMAAQFDRSYTPLAVKLGPEPPFLSACGN